MRKNSITLNEIPDCIPDGTPYKVHVNSSDTQDNNDPPDKIKISTDILNKPMLQKGQKKGPIIRYNNIGNNFNSKTL